MTPLNETRQQWIENHRDIRHNELSRDEARDWLRLMMADWKSFLVHAIYGYSLRRMPQEGITRIPHPELAEFCAGFVLKIQLANRNIPVTVSFPLFDRVDLDVLSKFGFTVMDPTDFSGGVQ